MIARALGENRAVISAIYPETSGAPVQHGCCTRATTTHRTQAHKGVSVAHKITHVAVAHVRLFCAASASRTWTDLCQSHMVARKSCNGDGSQTRQKLEADAQCLIVFWTLKAACAKPKKPHRRHPGLSTTHSHLLTFRPATALACIFFCFRGYLHLGSTFLLVSC